MTTHACTVRGAPGIALGLDAATGPTDGSLVEAENVWCKMVQDFLKGQEVVNFFQHLPEDLTFAWLEDEGVRWTVFHGATAQAAGTWRTDGQRGSGLMGTLA